VDLEGGMLVSVGLLRGLTQFYPVMVITHLLVTSSGRTAHRFSQIPCNLSPLLKCALHDSRCTIWCCIACRHMPRPRHSTPTRDLMQ
jgi:hypothetical protein